MRVILSTVSLWLAHLSVRDIGRHIHYMLPMIGRHIQVRGTGCPLLVGTFICAEPVVHYWSAHSDVRDMLSIIGRHIHCVRDMSIIGQLCETWCPLLVGCRTGCPFCASIIGGLHSIAWEAITITSAIVLAYGKP